ncbi:hypothetical protein [Stenotrophomonas oahuensis]|uniref:Uncharacterized protein n=1 Tax=Stenotrophomonas oahuensis TaxID=3003271 RepID=A0ABY9YTL0_9GAMM|nr:hypothetical protein [Stenotrophomonas sp. A5586]WNH54212.1 hypothetical protein PDM29_08040 [Stenotrophomonas sp. A5586]
MLLWIRSALALLLASNQAQAASDDPGLVLVQPKERECLDTRNHGRIPLVLTNRSAGRIAFHLSAPGQERNWIHARSFDIDFGPLNSNENVGVVLDEHFPSGRQVRFDPGDQMDVFVTADIWPTPGYTGKVRARLRDTEGRQYVSEELDVCQVSDAADTEK